MSYIHVVAAAEALAQLYRFVEPRLRGALSHRGIVLRQSIPFVSENHPSIDQGIAEFTAQVKADGILAVSGEFSNRTIYPASMDNWWFRHVHDMAHMLYQCEFDSAGETELHRMLWKWIESTPYYWSLDNDMQRWVWAVYYADTQGQTDYFDKHGDFPKDQHVFVAEEAERYYHKLEQDNAQA